MRCEEVRGFFSEYFDGEAECAEEISAHLQGCSACALEYEKFGELIEEVRTLPQPHLPADFRDDLMHDVLEQKLRKQRWQRRFHGQFAFAAAACFLLAVIWLPRVFDFREQFYEPYPSVEIAGTEPFADFDNIEMPAGRIGIAPAIGEIDIFEHDVFLDYPYEIHDTRQPDGSAYRTVIAAIITVALIAAAYILVTKRKRKR